MELLQRQLAAANRPAAAAAASDPSVSAASAASAAELTYLRGRVRDLTVANRALRRQLLRHTAAGAADAAVAAAAGAAGKAAASAGDVLAAAADGDGSGGEAAGGGGGGGGVEEELEGLRGELERVRGELEAARGEGERLMELSSEARAQRDRYAMQLVALLGAAAAQQQQVQDQQVHMQHQVQQMQLQQHGGGGGDYAVYGGVGGGGRHGSPPRAGSPGRAGSPPHRHTGTAKQGSGTAGGQRPHNQQQQGWYLQGQQTPGWAPGAGAGPPAAPEALTLPSGAGVVQRPGLPYVLPYNVLVGGGMAGGVPPGVVALPLGLGVGLGLVGPAAAVQQQAAAAAWLQALVAAASPGRTTLARATTIADGEEASPMADGGKGAGDVGSPVRQDGADRRSPSPPAVRYGSRAGVAPSGLLLLLLTAARMRGERGLTSQCRCTTPPGTPSPFRRQLHVAFSPARHPASPPRRLNQRLNHQPLEPGPTTTTTTITASTSTLTTTSALPGEAGAWMDEGPAVSPLTAANRPAAAGLTASGRETQSQRASLRALHRRREQQQQQAAEAAGQLASIRQRVRNYSVYRDEGPGEGGGAGARTGRGSAEG